MPGDAGSRQSVRVIFHGRVQGVGFRATAAQIARQWSVTGYARNQANGTVELAVQGEPAKVQNFLDALARRFRNEITDAVRADYQGEDLDSFEIRY